MNEQSKGLVFAQWMLRLSLFGVFFFASIGKLFVMGVPAFAANYTLPLWQAWLIAGGEFVAAIGILVAPFLGGLGHIVSRLSGLVFVIVAIGAVLTLKLAGFSNGFLMGMHGIYLDIAVLGPALYFLLRGNN